MMYVKLYNMGYNLDVSTIGKNINVSENYRYWYKYERNAIRIWKKNKILIAHIVFSQSVGIWTCLGKLQKFSEIRSKLFN